MPVNHTIDLKQRVVRTRSWGVVTDAELIKHKIELTNDPDFCPTMTQVCDCSGVERLDATSTGVRAMIDYDSRNADRRRGHRVACVAPADGVFGMARMYSQRSHGGPQVFEVF